MSYMQFHLVPIELRLRGASWPRTPLPALNHKEKNLLKSFTDPSPPINLIAVCHTPRADDQNASGSILINTGTVGDRRGELECNVTLAQSK